MPKEVKFSIPDWLWNLLPFLAIGLVTLLLWLSIWLVWPSWSTTLLVSSLVLVFLTSLIKQKEERKSLATLLLVILAISGLLFFFKNFDIQKKEKSPPAPSLPKKEKTKEKQEIEPASTLAPTYKYAAVLKTAKQCAMGAPPCNEKLFDWERVTQIVVNEQTIIWDPVENSEFWMIEKPPPEVEARLTEKQVYRVYFEVPPKPPEGRIKNPDESTRITVDKQTNQVVGHEQGWAATHAAPGQGETVPHSQWP